MNEMRYSEKIPGNRGNFHLTVRFDKTKDGYVGITQYPSSKDDRMERVLLTKAQFLALVKFAGSRSASR